MNNTLILRTYGVTNASIFIPTHKTTELTECFHNQVIIFVRKMKQFYFPSENSLLLIKTSVPVLIQWFGEREYTFGDY